MQRIKISSGSPWEAVVGYSRAVRVGCHVWVAGTTAVDSAGKVVGKNDPGKQTRYVLEIIRKALQEAGAGMNDVVRTRIFVRDISFWQEIGQVHGEVFKTIRPVSTMVQISTLIDPDILVEIEAEAYIEE